MNVINFLADNKEAVFMLLGGLGVFLYGIKLMGESLKAYAGDDLRDLINKYTSTPLRGVLVGMLSTVVIQSSSGTTALTISLVRAGLMDLRQAIGVIMGANIGTTVTAFLLGLAIKDYALPIMFVGALIFMFSSNRKRSLIGQIIFGFGSLFYGMVLMETPLKELASSPWFTEVITTVAHTPLLGVAIGAGLTMLVQSSSATIGILEGLYATGALGFPVAVSILLGDNIGTTITSVFASLGGSKDSKRAALSHVLFNVFGTILFFIVFYVLNAVGVWGNLISGLKPEYQIAITHLMFNATVTFILIWFVKQIEQAVRFIIPSTEETNEFELNDNFLDMKLVTEAPSLAIDQAKEGLINMAMTVELQMNTALNYIDKGEKVDCEYVNELEIGINAFDKKLKNFFMELSSKDLNEENSKVLNGYMYSINEFERVGDLTEKIVNNINRLNSEKDSLSTEAMTEIKKMFVVALSSVKKARQLYDTNDITLVGRIVEKERQLDRMERKYYKEHLNRVKNDLCKGKNVIEYIDLISDIERIGDHSENITEYFTNANHVLTNEEEDFDISELLHDIQN